MSRSYINTVALRRRGHRPATSDRVFHVFPELPIELRFLIVSDSFHSLPIYNQQHLSSPKNAPRSINEGRTNTSQWNQALIPRIIPNEALYTPCNPRLSIPLLAVNQESRNLALEKYQVWGEFFAPSTHIFEGEGAALARYNKYNRTRGYGIFESYSFPIQKHIMRFFSWNYVDFENDVLVIDVASLTNSEPKWDMGAIGRGGTMEYLFNRNRRSVGLDRVKNVAFDYILGVWWKETNKINMARFIRQHIVCALMMFKELGSVSFAVSEWTYKWDRGVDENVRYILDVNEELGKVEEAKELIVETVKRMSGGDSGWVMEWACPKVEFVRMVKGD